MTHKKLVEFAEMVANLKNEREVQGGLTWEDSVETINSLIAEARELTGVDPQHPLVGECYCDKKACPICSPGEVA